MSDPSRNNATTPIHITTTIDTAKLPDNHILIRIDHFGFSSNNVTYQSLGEHPHFRYYDFHSVPTRASDGITPQTHGLIPVWGFGTIQASNHPKLSVGERVYGFFALARYLVLPVSPSDVNKHAAYVPRPHLPPDRRPYNQILRCSSDPHYNPKHEELIMLYRPLFWTSYWFEDYLFTTLRHYAISDRIEQISHGEKRASEFTNFLISSASSKTAFCLAYLIHTRISLSQADERTRVVGLTSAKNVDFTKGLGLYTDVYPYDVDLDSLSNNDGNKWIYIDVAGNDALNDRIGAFFNRDIPDIVLEKAASLGFTNLSPASSEGSTKTWNRGSFASSSLSAPSLDSITPIANKNTIDFEQFFMPEWLAHRQRQLPILEIFDRQQKAWDALMRNCKSWISLECIRGATNVQKAYGEIVNGAVGPERGLVWSMWDKAEEGRLEARL